MIVDAIYSSKNCLTIWLALFVTVGVLEYKSIMDLLAATTTFTFATASKLQRKPNYYTAKSCAEDL